MKKHNWLFFTNIVLLVGIGLITLFSTVVGAEEGSGRGGVFNRQLLFVFVGFVAYFIVSNFDFRFIKYPQVVFPFYFLVTLGLLYVLIFGVEINGAKRWIFIGGVQIQVSEFAKLATIFVTACLFSMKDRYNIWILTLFSLILTCLNALLIFLEPDLSTAVITVLTVILMLLTVLPDHIKTLGLTVIGILTLILSTSLLSGGFQFWNIIVIVLILGISIFLIIRYREHWFLSIIFIALGIIGSVGIKYSWDHVLGDYQKARVTCFLDPEGDTTGACFQINQSIVAIGSGMVYGKGLGHGTQSKLQFLPEHQTDFIFASFAEEFGLLGSSIVLILYLYLIFSIFKKATMVGDYFGALVCLGIGVKVLLEVFINIGMNLGVLPTTGIPLPLMSSGGSIFLTTMISLGLVQSIERYSIEDQI